jgi:F-type H+-transporting ATPase subunit a
VESHAGPFEQFVVHRLVPIQIGNVDASFTNASLWMAIAVLATTVLMTLTVNKSALVPTRWQSLAELSYEFVANMVRDNVGDAGKTYFPFVFALFMFILFCNLLGLIPYSFTPTSQIVVTFAMAAVVFIGVTLIGFARHGVHFLSFFVPQGVPVFLLPLLIPIEILSYLFRPISLSVRLFANMLAGHTMFQVFAGFVIGLGILAGWMPLTFIGALYCLELLIAFLQAYVFTILTCLYLNDAIHMHH